MTELHDIIPKHANVAYIYARLYSGEVMGEGITDHDNDGMHKSTSDSVYRTMFEILPPSDVSWHLDDIRIAERYVRRTL